MNFSGALPKLVVFDLDYTLWPFWVDTHARPPFRLSNDKVVDTVGAQIKFFPEVPSVLKALKDSNVLIGVASRTTEIEGANQLIELFGWNKYIDFIEIYPGSKLTHFERLKNKSGVDYKHMLFFDDEDRNIVDLRKVNVTSILVENGVTMNELRRGLEEYSKKL